MHAVYRRQTNNCTATYPTSSIQSEDIGGKQLSSGKDKSPA